LDAKQLADHLYALARPAVEGEGLVLLDVETAPGRRMLFRFVIDGDGGVKIDDCVRVDRVVTDLLEEWDGTPELYAVEVTSPGLDRKIRRRDEYDHFRGRTARLYAETEAEGSREFLGTLEGMDGDQVLLRVDEETVRIPVDRIHKAKLLFEAPGCAGSGRKK